MKFYFLFGFIELFFYMLGLATHPVASNVTNSVKARLDNAKWLLVTNSDGNRQYWLPYPAGRTTESINSTDLGTDTQIEVTLGNRTTLFVAVTTNNRYGENAYE